MRTLFLAAIATLGIGCVGGLEGTPSPDPDPDPDPDPTATAKSIYETKVAPIMSSKCSGCHTAGQPAGNVTGFVDPVPAMAYDTMVGYVALVGNFSATTAPVLMKIQNGHQSLMYTQPEITNITEWLDKEIATRNPDPTPDPNPQPGAETASQATKRLYKEWSGCMTRADFDTANMAQGVGGWETNNNQECDNCHSTAAEGFLASRDGTFFFDNLAKHTALISQYFTVDLTGGVPTAKIIMNRVSFDGVSTRKAPHTEHPTFDSTDGGEGIQAISAFYTLTAAHAATPATCEVPAGRLID